MTKKILSIFAIIAVVITSSIVLSGCRIRTVHGRGDMTDRTFEVGNFNAINVSGAYRVAFSYDTDTSLEVAMQENLFEHFRVSVRNNTLYVSSRRNFTTTSTNTPRLYITAPSLVGVNFSGSTRTTDWDKIETDATFTIRTSGSSRINIEVEANRLDIRSSGSSNMNIEMDVDRLDVNLSGSSNMTFNGTAEIVTIVISGSGRVYGLGLETDNTTLTVSGSGRIYISVSNTLVVTISGSGRVRYLGNPTITQQISGSGSIQRV